MCIILIKGITTQACGTECSDLFATVEKVLLFIRLPVSRVHYFALDQTGLNDPQAAVGKYRMHAGDMRDATSVNMIGIQIYYLLYVFMYLCAYIHVLLILLPKRPTEI